jgi:ABC-type glycerol-3-phosphate transport system substrate-binding protein
MSNFQIALIGIFIFFIIAGMLTFASFGGLSGGSAAFPVLIWGTLPQNKMEDLIKTAGATAHYVEKNPATYENDFIEALASGKGPDIILLPQDLILKEKSRIFPIPDASYSSRSFKDTFIQEGEMYLTPQGSLGLPFAVDPLVLYWNRDIFTSEGLASPPTHWGDIYSIIDKLTQKDQSSIIKRSGLAFGEYSNVSHAKEILATLILQTGNVITAYDTQNTLRSTLSDKGNQTIAPAEAALSFYTGFADPLKTQYSWNRSMPDSREAFLAGDLAMYFGFASEYDTLSKKNPNLNFDVALIPQSQDSKAATTFGNMWALSVVNNSTHKADAVTTIGLLTSKDSISALSAALLLPPVRRDLLGEQPAANAAVALFNRAALQSKGWLDPDAQKTALLFKTMIESVTSGRALTNEAVTSANRGLEELLPTNHD